MASSPRDLEGLLSRWPYEPGEVAARSVQGRDGRPLLQLRVDLGVLQMEIDARPDGARPMGYDTYYEYLLSRAVEDQATPFELDEPECAEIDREFVQFYHRRVAWLALREFERAVADADHTLSLLDFSSAHALDDDWVELHEQYRPFVLFHRTQASVLGCLESNEVERALMVLDEGLTRLQQSLLQLGAEEDFAQEDFVQKLLELRTSIRKEYEVRDSLADQLAEAIACEQYELAAKLRDQITQAE